MENNTLSAFQSMRLERQVKLKSELPSIYGKMFKSSITKHDFILSLMAIEKNTLTAQYPELLLGFLVDIEAEEGKNDRKLNLMGGSSKIIDSSINTLGDFISLPLDKQLAFKSGYPELYKSFFKS